MSLITPRHTSRSRSGIFRWGGLIVFCGLLGLPGEAFAQRYKVLPGPNQPRQPRRPSTRPKEAANSKTMVSVELVAGMGGVGYQAQLWRPVFEQLGVDVRIRTGNINDKPEVKEDTVGTFRRVTVIGKLDRRGQIVLPDRTFSRSQSANLGKYLEDLKKFGQQGNPTGKPLWGLNAEQFGDFYKAFSVKVEKSAKDKSLEEAMKELDLPAQYPVRMSEKANDWLKSEFPRPPKFRQSVEGFSLGAAFAMVLNEYGLGFQPTRTPAGKIEISILPIRETTKVWPVGWQLKDSRHKTAPSLFKLVPIDLDNLALLDVLNAVSVKSKVPVRYDHWRIEANRLDLDTMRVSYPSRQTSFSLLLRGVTNRNLLAYDLKIDELGQPFIWIKPLRLGKLGR